MSSSVKSKAPVTLDLLNEMGKAFNNHDIDGIMSYFADDGVFILARGPDPWGKSLKGKNEIRALLTERFKTSKNMKWSLLNQYVCGNNAVTEWLLTGTTGKGEELNLFGCDLFVFNDDGKIVKKDTYWKSKEPIA
jgi:hypothetical protein